MKALKDYLNKMLAAGKIRQSKSPAGAPILFVKKKDRSLRLCINYRGLNRVTVKDRIPLPLIGELRERVSGARRFSKIDLKNGYNLIRIAKGHEWKTAFRTRYGHYEYLVMPFGLCNALATFQAMMNHIFRDLLDQRVIYDIDDILIYASTVEEYDRLVTEVLTRLKEANLVANAAKCVWGVSEVEFLGYIVADK